MAKKFIDMLVASLESKESHVCVGLDSRYDKLPASIRKGASVADAIFLFNKHVIEATHDIAVAYKSNIAFYSAFGAEGLEGLRQTNEYLRASHPSIPIFADYKRSEMGDGVKMLAHEVFDWLQFTCVMVTPWFGSDTVTGFLTNPEHGVCVYVHDSNPSAGELQDLMLKDGLTVYEYVTKQVVSRWNSNGNVMVEAGATYPTALSRVRNIVGEDMPILTSGVGAQGASVNNLTGAFGKNGKRLLVNSSRGIIFAGQGKKQYFESVRAAADQLRQTLLDRSLKR